MRDLTVTATGKAGTDDDPWRFTLAAAESGAEVSLESIRFAGVETVSGGQQQATTVMGANRVQNLVADHGPLTVFYGNTGVDVIMAGSVPTGAEIKAALEALQSIRRVEVGGAGTTADPWRVVFVDADKANDRYLALRVERYVDLVGTSVQNSTPFAAGIPELQRLNLGARRAAPYAPVRHRAGGKRQRRPDGHGNGDEYSNTVEHNCRHSSRGQQPASRRI